MLWNRQTSLFYSVLIAICNAAKPFESWEPYYNSTFRSLNVTGSTSFPPPIYTNDKNTAQNWTISAGIGFVDTINPTNVSIAERIWIESPVNTIQQNGPNQAIEVERDVCWVAFPGARIMPQHGLKKNETGNNGCDTVWGGTCSAEFSRIIKTGFSTAINANGSLDCSVAQFDMSKIFWDIRSICHIIALGGSITAGKLATFNPHEKFQITLVSDSITNTHSNTPFAAGNDTLHGNYTSNYLLETELSTSSPIRDNYPNFTSAYDSAAQSINHMFFVTGPIKGGDNSELDVSMVCVKYSQVAEGSRSIPKDNTSAGNVPMAFPYLIGIVLIFLVIMAI